MGEGAWKVDDHGGDDGMRVEDCLSDLCIRVFAIDGEFLLQAMGLRGVWYREKLEIGWDGMGFIRSWANPAW